MRFLVAFYFEFDHCFENQSKFAEKKDPSNIEEKIYFECLVMLYQAEIYNSINRSGLS